VVFNRMRADYARRPSLDTGEPWHQRATGYSVSPRSISTAAMWSAPSS